MGVRSSSGGEVDFEESWAIEVVLPFFSAVSEGTRRPRARFSESKIAIESMPTV